MTPFALAALILALVAEFIDHGKSIVGWAVIVLCIGLLWGHLGL